MDYVGGYRLAARDQLFGGVERHVAGACSRCCKAESGQNGLSKDIIGAQRPTRPLEASGTVIKQLKPGKAGGG